jgi:hypothetical protein
MNLSEFLTFAAYNQKPIFQINLHMNPSTNPAIAIVFMSIFGFGGQLLCIRA